MIKIFIGVLITAFVVIVGFMIIDPELGSPNTSEIMEVTSRNTAKYTVEGDVFKPGTYSFNKDEVTMEDLVNAAGGPTSTTDIRCYFETTVISSGTTYFIGSLYDSSDICNNQELQKVNINEDSASELTSINGITSSIANSIVSWRVEHGQFLTIEDLLEVYGIGTATYKKVRNFVILHEWYSYLYFFHFG